MTEGKGPSIRLVATHGVALAIAALAVTSTPVAAQAGGEHPQTPASGAAINLNDAPRPTAFASRATGAIQVDGTLDEAAWRAAQVIDQFYQQKPDAGLPATERTEVRILFDDDNLYIGAELYDSRPEALVIPTLQRDPDTRNGDAFGLSLDTFLDGKSSFAFFINPGGAVRDSQTSDDGRINNGAWDGAYDLRTSVHDQGWTVEMAIPWSQLRFDPTRPEQVWGLNLLRRIRRKNEDATWAPMDVQWRLYAMSRAGRLRGLEGIQPSRNLSVKPFVLAAQPSGDLQVGADAEFDAGADLKLGLTPGLTLDLTVNTDFSQVEVDQQQVNLTRFSLFFPEKREFFLENQGVFQFGDQGSFFERTGATSRDFTLFHSRRIGLTPTGSPLPILGGGRVSGTVGPVALGVLNMQTREQDGFNPENFTVGRVRGEVARGLTLGGIFVNRATTSGDQAANRSYGVDASLQAFNDYLLIQSYWAATEGSAADGSSLGRSPAGRLSVRWRDPFWEALAMYRQFGEDFDPGAGFVVRRGMRHGFATLGVHPRVDWPGFELLNPYVETHYFEGLDGTLETREIKAGLDAELSDGGRTRLSVSDRFERVDRPFSVRGATIEPGAYDFTEAEATYETSGARIFTGQLDVSGGGYFGGDRFSVGGTVTGRVGHQLLLELSAQRNRITLPGLEPVSANVYGAKLDGFYSTRLMTSAFVQYNAATQEFVTNVRFRWIHAPLSDLYVVLTERRDTDAGRVLDRFLTLKFTKLVAF